MEHETIDKILKLLKDVSWIEFSNPRKQLFDHRSRLEITLANGTVTSGVLRTLLGIANIFGCLITISQKKGKLICRFEDEYGM